MFLKNAWYVAAWDHEVTADKPFGRVLLNEPVVMYRDTRGQLVALEDRCCHRHYPLNRGVIVGDRIECLYHGLQYDRTGKCVRIPAQEAIPATACVKSYPVVERNHWVWIWMGDPALADPAKIVDFKWLDHPLWRAKGTTFHVKGGYELVIENLLDLSHLTFVHKSTIGNYATAEAAEVKVRRTDDDVTVGPRTYRNVPLSAFLPALHEAVSAGKDAPLPPAHHEPTFTPDADAEIHVERLIHAVAAHLDARHGFLIDPGDCLFASVELPVPAWSLASAYYATMGYAVPASLGAGKADPGHRPVVLTGDGSFAMTGLEAGWVAFNGVFPIIIVMDNNGYGTQRPMRDGPFNDIAPLAISRLVDVFGTGRSWRVTTEDELETALTEAFASDGLALVHVVVRKGSTSPALARFAEALGKRV